MNIKLLKKNNKTFIIITIAIILSIAFLYFNNKTFDQTNNIKIIEKEVIKENKIYEEYENKTFLGNTEFYKKNIGNIINSLKEINKDKKYLLLDRIEKDRTYNNYYKQNDLGYKLVKYIIENDIDISDIELNNILRLKENTEKISKIIKKNTIFLLPFDIPLNKDNEIKTSKIIKFNLKGNTISIKEKKEILDEWQLVYSGYIDLDFLINRYVFDIFYFYSKDLQTGGIVIKTVDLNGKIEYNFLGVGFSENESNLSIITNKSSYFNKKINNKRINCDISDVIQETIYLTNNNEVNLLCIKNDKEIYQDIILK